MKKFKNFDLIELKFKKEHKYIIDDHPNIYGHKFISQEIYRYLTSSI